MGCSSLTVVYCYAERVPTTEGYAFSDSPISSATLHVPAASIDTYKKYSPWKDFGTIVALSASGDVNGDGTTNLSDAIMIVYHSLGQQQEGFNEAAADVNSDGDVDLTDAIIVVYQSLGAE